VAVRRRSDDSKQETQSVNIGTLCTTNHFPIGYHSRSNSAMGSNQIDLDKISNEVFVYSPLLSKEAEETGFRKNASVAFSNGKPYTASTFYREGGQEALLDTIRVKAKGIHHITCERFTSIDVPERGLMEYYNISKNGVRRIGKP